MEVRVYLRKGGKNRKFLKIVDEVKSALEGIGPEGRIQGRLLTRLRGAGKELANAWQDGDELKGMFGKKYGYRFDIYNWNTKTAIEVEESEVKYLWKDFIKLAIGARKSKVENGIVICPFEYTGLKDKAHTKMFNEAKNISEFMSDFLWVKNLAIIGYSKKPVLKRHS